MKDYSIRICKACYDLKEGTCNEPECVFCRRTKDEVSIILDILLIRPIIDGEQIDMEAEEEKDNIDISVTTHMQDLLMKFDPVDGTKKPYPSHAKQYRKWHGETAWIYNPWAGTKRDPRDIGSDVLGYLIMP